MQPTACGPCGPAAGSPRAPPVASRQSPSRQSPTCCNRPPPSPPHFLPRSPLLPVRLLYTEYVTGAAARARLDEAELLAVGAAAALERRVEAVRLLDDLREGGQVVAAVVSGMSAFDAFDHEGGGQVAQQWCQGSALVQAQHMHAGPCAPQQAPCSERCCRMQQPRSLSHCAGATQAGAAGPQHQQIQAKPGVANPASCRAGTRSCCRAPSW